MGANAFIEFGYGDGPREVFDALVDQARYENGHGGYSGTIAEKNTYRVVTLPEGEAPAKFADRMSMKEGRDGFADKWGPAGACEVPVDGEIECPECKERISLVEGKVPDHKTRYGSYQVDGRGREIPGSRKPCGMIGKKVRKWCFFGWASS